MKTILPALLAIALISPVSTSLASFTEHDNIMHYSGKTKSIASIASNAIQHYGKSHTIIVLDDDNTLTTMPQVLGGVGWFNWQSNLLNKAPKNKMLVANNFGGLLDAQNLLFNVSKMDLTDNSIPAALNLFAQRGVRIIVETARGPDMSNITEKQLTTNRITNAKGVLLFKTSGLRNPNYPNINVTSYPTTLSCPSFSRPVRYTDGILYLAGQNKGVGLNCLLHTLSAHDIKAIVFADDLQSRVDQLRAEYKDSKAMHVDGIHFTKYDDRDQTPSTSEQREATAAYNNTSSALHGNLAKANVPAR
jgi:hypothetical protein